MIIVIKFPGIFCGLDHGPQIDNG